jgi:hypothetical protein
VYVAPPPVVLAFQTLPLEAYKNLVVPIGQPAHWVRQPKKLAVVLAQSHRLKLLHFFVFLFELNFLKSDFVLS